MVTEGTGCVNAPVTCSSAAVTRGPLLFRSPHGPEGKLQLPWLGLAW